MNVKELQAHLIEIATLEPHEELPQVRELALLLTEKCVEVADLRYPGLAKVLERLVQREHTLTKLCSVTLNC